MKGKRTERKRCRRKKKGGLAGIIVAAVIGAVIWNADSFPLFSDSYKEVRSSVTVRGEEEVQCGVTGQEEAGGFYYQKLSGDEQEFYDAIWQGVKEEKEYIEIPTTDGEQAAKIYEYLLYDRPELFWCDGTSRMTVYEEKLWFYPGYHCTGEKRQERQAQIQAAVKTCLEGISEEMSDYGKIRYIFEYLVETIDYESEAPDNQNIYSSLVNKKSVCAGYARAAQYLMQQTGIECIYAVGDIAGQGAHAWNIVNCEGKYYQMDVTFGDPVFLKEEEDAILPQSAINYDYLCCTDEEISKTHREDKNMTYPACTSEDLNYYRLEGMYYEAFDKEEMLEKMNESFYTGQSFFACKFADSELYLQAHDTIIEELIPSAAANLADYYGMSSVQYTYVEDEKLNKITVFWNYEK